MVRLPYRVGQRKNGTDKVLVEMQNIVNSFYRDQALEENTQGYKVIKKFKWREASVNEDG
jgi:hypothetical protein